MRGWGSRTGRERAVRAQQLQWHCAVLPDVAARTGEFVLEGGGLFDHEHGGMDLDIVYYNAWVACTGRVQGGV